MEFGLLFVKVTTTGSAFNKEAEPGGEMKYAR